MKKQKIKLGLSTMTLAVLSAMTTNAMAATGPTIIGTNANGSNSTSIAIGYEAKGTEIAIGNYAENTGSNQVAIGSGVYTQGDAAIAIGAWCETCDNNKATALGLTDYRDIASHDRAATKAVGSAALSIGNRSIVMGGSSSAYGSLNEIYTNISSAVGSRNVIKTDEALLADGSFPLRNVNGTKYNLDQMTSTIVSGNMNTATNTLNTQIVGTRNTLTNVDAAVLGDSNTVKDGAYAIAIGDLNNISASTNKNSGVAQNTGVIGGRNQVKADGGLNYIVGHNNLADGVSTLNMVGSDNVVQYDANLAETQKYYRVNVQGEKYSQV